MTGKITVGTIQDTAGDTVASTFVTSGVSKSRGSWANSASTNQILDQNSINVSSGADNGVGIFTVSYTNNFDAVAKYNYGTSLHLTTVDMAVYGVEDRNTGNDKYRCCDATGPTDSEVDHARNLMIVFGDLA